MSQNSFSNINYRCGEIFQKENQEFIIICLLCQREFYSFSIFTNHLIHKICSTNIPHLLQETLKIEKNIIDDLLVQPKIEQANVENTNNKQINNTDECSNKLKPKIEPIEISDDNSEGEGEQIKKSESVNKNMTILNKNLKETKTKKRTRIIKKKIIWDPDDPKTQLLCENYQNQSPKKQINKFKEIGQPPAPPKLQIKQLPNKLDTVKLNNNKQILIKTVPKQSRIQITPREPEQSQPKKIKRIKKVIWDPDDPDNDIHIYKSKTNNR